MSKATDIAGYTFQVAVRCPRCTMEALAEDQGVHAPLTDTEGWLSFMAEVMEIDRLDETTFDSSEFPKVIFYSQVEGDKCEDCGEYLGGSWF